MAEFKDMLKYFRKREGLSQKELAVKVGVSPSTISMYEVGERRPDFEIEETLADFFNVNLNTLRGKDSEGVTLRYQNVHPLAKQSFPVLGDIACGEPKFMDEQYEVYTSARTSIHADFILIASGDSMVNARIHDGDMVFIRQQPMVENGEIAAVAIGDEATLKRFYRYGDDLVVLRPENPAYEEQRYAGDALANVRILGKAVAFQGSVK